jgi:hypothetical protein
LTAGAIGRKRLSFLHQFAWERAMDMATTFENEPLEEALKRLPENLGELMSHRNGGFLLADKLQTTFPKELVVKDTGELRTSECVGIHFLNQHRYPEALAVFQTLYHQMLDGQKSEGRYKKGMPLVWISGCYNQQGYVSIAHRYLMLTLI